MDDKLPAKTAKFTSLKNLYVHGITYQYSQYNVIAYSCIGNITTHVILRSLLIVIDVSRDSLRTRSLSMSKDDKSPNKGNSTSDSGVVTQDVKMNTMEGKNYQSKSNADSTTLGKLAKR